MLKPPPLALYLHLPWCVSKCPYCDFNSHALCGPLPEVAYVDALLDDLREELASIQERSVSSIFFGGGTPSLFSPAAVARLIELVAARGRLAEGAEITLEANPGAVEHGSFSGYRAAGINRVSLGVQSFDEQQLSVLGRIHGTDDSYRALDEIRRADIPRVNIDLMFGLPGQSVADAVKDLTLALDTGVRHVSHYQLTIEPNTLFYSRPPRLPEEESIWSSQQACQAALAAAGLEQYEVSAFAVPGQECEHNLNYWTYGDYIGVGAGAHGKLTRPDESIVLRRRKKRHPQAYMQDPARTEATEVIEGPQRVFEFMLNALRLRKGFPARLIEERTGVRLKAIQPLLDRASGRGLLEIDPLGCCRPTDLGFRFLNDLQGIFLPDEPSGSEIGA